MTTTTPTLAEFLLARLAEDEAEAEKAASHNGGGVLARDDYGCLLVQPACVLADVEAKRRIVALHAPSDEHLIFSKPGPSGPTCAVCVAFHADIDCEHQRYPCDTLRYLAQPFADHPDYREEWRP